MEYEINSKKINKLIPLPAEINKYINEVSGECLKVLLTIFSSEKNIKPCEIATKLDLKISQVEDAFRFWKSKEIINIAEKHKPSSHTSYVKKPSASQISSEELKEAKKQNKYVNMLFKQSEQLYSRPLKPMERRNLLYIYEFFELPIDVILMVVDFCIRYNKPQKQILSICETMSDNNITTHEQAEREIQKLTEKYTIENQIRHCFGIYDRKLSTNEKKLISKWFSEYNFKINMIRLAFNKCIDSIGKLSFQYINKILINWKKENIKTPEDLEKFENTKKQVSKLPQPKKTSYNLEELVAQSGLYIPE